MEKRTRFKKKKKNTFHFVLVFVLFLDKPRLVLILGQPRLEPAYRQIATPGRTIRDKDRHTTGAGWMERHRDRQNRDRLEQGQTRAVRRIESQSLGDTALARFFIFVLFFSE